MIGFRFDLALALLVGLALWWVPVGARRARAAFA